MFTVIQFTANKFAGQWSPVTTLAEAVEIIDSLKISGAGSTFSVEDADGVIVHVTDRKE